MKDEKNQITQQTSIDLAQTAQISNISNRITVSSELTVITYLRALPILFEVLLNGAISVMGAWTVSVIITTLVVIPPYIYFGSKLGAVRELIHWAADPAADPWHIWSWLGIPVLYTSCMLIAFIRSRFGNHTLDASESTVISYPRTLPIIFDTVANTITLIIGFLTAVYILLFSVILLLGAFHHTISTSSKDLGLLASLELFTTALLLLYVGVLKAATSGRLVSPKHELKINEKGIIKQPSLRNKKLRLLYPGWNIQLSWKNLKLTAWSMHYPNFLRSMVRRFGGRLPSKYLIFRQPWKFRPICIPVDWLQDAEKQKLLESLQRWAPDLVLDQEVTKLLVGEELARVPEYTELWMQAFADRKRKRELNADDTLQNGRYQVTERLGTGGQGTAYLAFSNVTDSINDSPEHSLELASS